MRALDRLEDGQRLRPYDPRVVPSVLVAVSIAEVAEGSSLTLSVADLAGDRQPRVVELDRLSQVSEIGISVSEITERNTLATSVTDLAGYRQLCLVERDRLVRVAETGMGEAETAKVICFSPSAANLTTDC